MNKICFLVLSTLALTLYALGGCTPSAPTPTPMAVAYDQCSIHVHGFDDYGDGPVQYFVDRPGHANVDADGTVVVYVETPLPIIPASEYIFTYSPQTRGSTTPGSATAVFDRYPPIAIYAESHLSITNGVVDGSFIWANGGTAMITGTCTTSGI